MASTSVGQATLAKGGRRILVVDDNIDFVQTLGMVLELHGHQVEVAFDGVAGLEAALRAVPDVVVLDVGLPKLNGYEVCRRIREESLPVQPMIIGATGWSQLVDRTLGRYAGFDAQLVKPFGYDALATLLDTAPSRS